MLAQHLAGQRGALLPYMSDKAGNNFVQYQLQGLINDDLKRLEKVLLTTPPLMLTSILALIGEMLDLNLLAVHRVAFLLFDLCGEILLKEQVGFLDWSEGTAEKEVLCG